MTNNGQRNTRSSARNFLLLVAIMVTVVGLTQCFYAYRGAYDATFKDTSVTRVGMWNRYDGDVEKVANERGMQAVYGRAIYYAIGLGVIFLMIVGVSLTGSRHKDSAV